MASITKESVFRKPSTGLWNRMLEILEKPSVSKDSFYCGDAAGRKGDHSNDDLLYAVNCKVKFYTPEMWFKGEKINYKRVLGEIEEEKEDSK